MKADYNCPSCHGHGSATIIAGGITVAGGACRCVGGQVWAVAEEEKKWPDDFRGFDTNVKPRKAQ